MKKNPTPKEMICLMIVYFSSLELFVMPRKSSHISPKYLLRNFVESMQKSKYWNFIRTFSVTYLVVISPRIRDNIDDDDKKKE